MITWDRENPAGGSGGQEEPSVVVPFRGVPARAPQGSGRLRNVNKRQAKKIMTANEGSSNDQPREKAYPASGKTIDLQGVAAFVGLVELLATELGTTAGRIQGLLPSGPVSFEELVGEIVVNSQGFHRTLVLLAKPGSPLRLRFTSSWHNGQTSDPEMGTISGVEAHIFLPAAVEQILPQGRALARYCEDAFVLLDGMVTIGQSGRLSSMSLSASEIEAFEQDQAGNLVRNFSPKKSPAIGE